MSDTPHEAWPMLQVVSTGIASKSRRPSTIRILADVDDARVALTRLDTSIREIMRTSDENVPTEEEAGQFASTIHSVVDKLNLLVRSIEGKNG